MRKLIFRLGVGLLVLAISLPSGAQDSNARLDGLEEKVRILEERLSGVGAKDDAKAFNAYWKEGLHFDSVDGTFKLRVGGRIHNDWAWFDQDGALDRQVGNWQDGTEFRRARLYFEGLLYDTVEFKAEYDFADGDSDFTDVYLGLRDVPHVGRLRIGHFKEPFSLEEVTGDNYTTFMERGLPNAFVPSRNTGIMVHNHVLDDRATWAFGVFRETNDFGDGQDDGGYNITGRITGLPIYEDEGSRLVHLGIAYSHHNPSDGDQRYSQRPESNQASELVDTGEFSADDADLVGLEAAVVCGAASFQGEYIAASVDRGGPDPDFFGLYLQASYFLTGEHREYSRSRGAFTRVKPKKNFLGEEGGLGAWELAARYSHLDLEDAGINGGELDNFTIGANWHLNPNTRVMLNWVFADADDRYDGEGNILQMRFQIDF